MTSQEIADKLATLEEARSQLEAALASDENWRALRQGDLHDDDWSSARQARDTRLAMALEANPLYRAWQHVNEAIDALRVDGPQIEPPRALDPGGAQREENLKTGEVTGELPEDILSILRRDAARAEPAPRVEPRDQQHLLDADRAHATAALAENKIDNAERDTRHELAARVPSSQSSELARRMDRIDAGLREMDVREAEIEIVREPAKRKAPSESLKQVPQGSLPRAAASEDPASKNEAPVGGGGVGRIPERVEATVTFVTRAPRVSLLPATQIPADLGSERKTQLFERLRGVGDAAAPEPAHESFAASRGPVEEAEVTIMTAQAARQKQQADQRTGAVKRFLKALSGD